MKEKFRRFRLSSGVLVTALLILIITAVLFFLIRSGILMPSSGDGEQDLTTAGILPEMDAPGTVSAEYYTVRDREPAEMLGELSECDTFRWSYRAVEAWENEYTMERTVVIRQGEKFRIEKENLLVICDGETLYRREGMLETQCPADASDLYTEAGLTPLTAVQSSPDDGYTCTLEYDDPVNPKNIRMSRSRDGYRDEFVISIEAGIPITERSYVGSMAYRMVLTDEIDMDYTPDGSEFEIPLAG